MINFATKICLNPLLLWDKSDLEGKWIFQNLMLPEGIIHNCELDHYQTSGVNSLFSSILQMTKGLGGHKKRDSIKINKIPSWVNPAVQNSNHFVDDLKLLSDPFVA